MYQFLASASLFLAQAEASEGLSPGSMEFWQEVGFVQSPRILLTLLVFIGIHIAVRITLTRIERQVVESMIRKRDNSGEVEKRMNTLFGVINKGALLGVWAVGFLVVLGQLEIKVGPIIAAAGIFGLALSFGAQSLVKDLISGMFILLENQIRVGDVALINGTGGLVEEINLRTVVLRDLHGTVHVFPNGNINSLANMTKDWSAIVLDIGVAYKEDPDLVMEAMLEVAKEMKEDPEWSDKIVQDMEMMGVNEFGDSAVVIRGRIKTRPIAQWAVGREYRRRLKHLFDKRGISIPFPHRTLYFGEASEAFQVLMAKSEAVTDLRLPRPAPQPEQVEQTHPEEHHKGEN